MYRHSSITIAVIALALGLGCDSATKWDAGIPYPPSNPSPRDGSTAEAVSTRLSWEAGADPDRVWRYDLYLGTELPPPLVARDRQQTEYWPDRLQPEATYYWQVVARDSADNVSKSPIWSFTTSATSGDFVFPLVVGNWWEYEQNMSWTYVSGDTGRPLIDYSTELRCSVDSLRTDSITRHFVNQIDTQVENDRMRTHSWFSNQSDGLYSIDSRGTILGSFIQPNAWPTEMRPAGRFLSEVLMSAGDLGSTARVLAYPLEVGASWVHSDSREIGLYLIEKEVTELRTIVTPAGEFECWVITWEWTGGTWGNQAERLDYFSDIGLVYSRVTVKDMEVTSPEYPDGGVVADYVSETWLTGYHLVE